MTKLIFVISLIIVIYSLVSPLIGNVISSFFTGLSSLGEYSTYILQFLTKVFNLFTEYYYLMYIFYIFIALSLISLLISNLSR